ncbi:hypothetical protein F5B19DRAFT_490091 [Rostrohypoxylon terebratum]|nr:hypothetical protein F5B19DRAFT_490091 [Rostrohypoxylon terebratum]
MESSPLIKAHDHARAASIATHTSDTTVAVNEHTRAAGEFANAAKNTSSVEALRTLKLLEQHHRRLSELLQIPGKVPTSQNSENDSQVSEKDEAAPGVVSATTSSKSDGTGASTEKGSQPLPTLPKQSRYPARDLGASIASNLASARGIRSKYRSQPLSPSISNTEAPGNMDAASRRSGRTKMQTMLDNSDAKPSTLSPEKEKERSTRQPASSTQSQAEASTTTTNNDDEGFSRFYSAFGSIINRISAPLAFAGLPLISEEDPTSPTSTPNTNTPATATPPTPQAEPAPKTPVQKRVSRVRGGPAAEPDLRKLYSKAALRAVARDGGGGPSANDSFYVVPTSGHTASYASILTFADKEKRRLEAQGQGGGGGGRGGSDIGNHDDEDFVDARGASPALQRGGGRSGRTFYGDSRDGVDGRGGLGVGSFGKGDGKGNGSLNNVVEELYTENASLKNMLDQLSRRLHAFESMSQNSGMRLAESIRLMRPGSPLSAAGVGAAGGGGGGGGGGSRAAPPPSTPSPSAGTGAGTAADDTALAKRNRELEDQIHVMTRQMEEMERSYNKARANLVRYREKWEQLKAGAKARRAGGSASGSAQAGGGGGGSSEVAGAGEEAGLRSPALA